MKIGTDITPVSFSLTRESTVEGELRHIGVGSPKRLFGRLVGAIKEVWVHIIPLQGGGGRGAGRGGGRGREGGLVIAWLATMTFSPAAGRKRVLNGMHIHLPALPLPPVPSLPLTRCFNIRSSLRSL